MDADVANANAAEQLDALLAPYPVREHCDRIKDEWNDMLRLWTAVKRDVDRSDQERLQLTDHFVRFYTLCYKLHVESLVQNEANRRVQTILEGMLSHLGPDSQKAFAGEIEGAKVLSVKELEERIRDGGAFPRLASPAEMDAVAKTAQASAMYGVSLEVPFEATASSQVGTPVSPSLGTRMDIEDNISSDDGPQFTPTRIRPIATLPHGDVVCAVAVANNARHVYTGGKGCVKVWDMLQPSVGALDELECLQDHYIRSCKLLSDADVLIVGGEADRLCMWDLGGTTPNMMGYLETTAPACYALAVSPLTAPSRAALCFTCCSDGKINVFDVHNKKLIKSFMAHPEGASCLDITRDGSKMVTGGLDKMVRVWDLYTFRAIDAFSFPSQVFSLGTGNNDYVAAGLENSELKVFNIANRSLPLYTESKHNSSVLSLKFSHSGSWFATTGKDALLNGWRCPTNHLFEYKENSSILVCDVSLDDKYIVTGSSDKLATVYEVS